MNKEKILKRLDFEKTWLENLLVKDQLQTIDIENSFIALKTMIKEQKND